MSDTKVYRVRDGVAWVNGARVPDDRKVRLTAAEARFDLEQGRIAPAATKAARRAPAAKQDVADDGRD